MPFNNPLQRAAKPPSPPHRNISNASSSNTASSTSSLEAAPIKPPPIQTRTAATTAEQLGDRESRTGTYRDRRRVETSTSPTTPRMPGDGFTQGPDGTSSSSQTATFAQSTPTQQHHQYGHSDFPAHLLPAELRPSSSGPDLASLRQRIADAQLQRNTAAAIEEQRAQRRRSSFNPDTQGREDVEDGHKKRPLSTGDVSATEDDNTAQTNQESHVRTKLRTRSSSAQVTQIVSRLRNVTASAGGSTTPISMEARKAVSLQDFTFGEVLGRGSYSTVVLAQQKATHIPYAIKILDQHHLVQEKKTKYAKIERDALVLLGPRQPPRAGSFSSASSVGAVPRNRRESVAESVQSAMSETSRKREENVGDVKVAEGSRPRTRRNVSADGVKRVSLVYPSTSPHKATRNGMGNNEDELNDGHPRQSYLARRVSAVKEQEQEQEQEQGEDRVNGTTKEGLTHNVNMEQTERADNEPPSSPSSLSSPDKRPLSGFSETALNNAHARDRLSSISAAMTITPDSHENLAKRRTYTGDGSDRLMVPGQEDGFEIQGSHARRRKPRYSHPGVVRLHYTFKDESSLYFVLDLAINGELLSFVKKYGSLDIVSARVYAAQIIDTIDFMHERGVIHRDIKPENILLDDEMRVKITDFGSAKIVQADKSDDPKLEESNSRKRSFVGTAEYVSPEVLRNDHASYAADIWAFGCVLFQMIAGRPPFRGATEYLTFQKVLHAEYEYPEGFDLEARDLLERIFKLDPTERPTIEEIKVLPFFSNVGFEDIWTDRMPEIHTGIHVPPPPNQHVNSSGRGWDELLTTPETDDDNDDPFNHEEGPQDAEDLEEPRRKWIENGGGVGTFSSGSMGTDDSASLRGGATARAVSSPFGRPKVLPSSGKGMGTVDSLQRRGSVHQKTAQEKKDMWAQHLLKNEYIVYSSPILSRSGLFLPKRRTLVLTSLPRLICVKEDLLKGKMKVKSECLFKSSTGAVPEGGPDVAMRNPKKDVSPIRQTGQSVDPRVVTKIIEKGPRAFVVSTANRDYNFIADREDIRKRWMQELKRAQPSTGHDTIHT